MNKKRLEYLGIALALLLIASPAFGQITIFTDNFNNACTAGCLAPTHNGWTVSSTGANGAFANDWFVSCAENGEAPGNCGLGCGADPSLHLSSVAGSPAGLCPTGDCGAVYDASIASIITNKRVESPTINCSSFNTITLTYDHISSGAAGTDFHTIEYSSNGGSTWTTLTTGPSTNCCCSLLDCFFAICCSPTSAPCGSLRQGLWGQNTIALPATADFNANVKIGFNWTNNGDNVGTDPSIAIDDLLVEGLTGLATENVRFIGKYTSLGNHLKWQIQSPKDVRSISLLKSEKGLNFKEIDFLPGNQLEFIDLNQYETPSFYCLKILQDNGSHFYSKILEVGGQIPNILSIKAFPNPLAMKSEMELHIETKMNGNHKIDLFDLYGKKITSLNRTLEPGTHSIPQSSENLQSGVYLIRIYAGGESAFAKVLIQ